MSYIETNGIKTYYEQEGDGQSVVFIHGLGMDNRTWRPQVDALVEEYEVTTYDYRGHGNTETGNPSDYPISLLVSDLRTLIKELNIENPVLCGHSYGGIIAAEYAHQYPDDVAGLVFAEARTDIGERLWERAFVRLQPAIHQLEDLVGEDRVQRARMAIVKRLEDAERGANPEVEGLGMTVEEYMRKASDQFERDDEAAFMQAGINYIGTTPTAFDVPVLYMYGELGADVIGGKAERLQRAPTDVRVREIEDADHFISLQQPTEFNEILGDFLADIHEKPLQADASAAD